MAPPVRAEVTLTSLKNCMVNLPPNLIALLSSKDTPPQNVVVELQYRSPTLSHNSAQNGNNAASQRSAYVGWTGHPSKTRTASLMNDRARGGREQETPAVEIDTTFAKLLGLSEGQKVGVLVHIDPPSASTINIEPLTPADWEVIELHATFLELNLLSQIRALPNPDFKSPSEPSFEHNHPLTLNLSPTSTANIVITSLSPALPNTVPFAKISPDAEVIVAPKTRPKSSRNNRGDARSIASRRSGKSGVSARTSMSKRASNPKDSLYLRAADFAVAGGFLSAQSEANPNSGLKIWLSKDVISSEALKGTPFASVTIVKPAGLRVQLDQTQMQHLKDEESSDVGRPALRVVVRVVTWTKPVDDNHTILSSELCSMLGVSNLSGLLVRVEAAGPPLSRSSLKSFVFFPFLPATSKKKEGLKFGGDSKIQRQALIDRLKITHGGDDGLLSGPLTDGMMLPPSGDPNSSSSFEGGILRFDQSANTDQDSRQALWVLGGEQRQDFDARSEIPRPLELTVLFPTFAHGLPADRPRLIGIDSTLKQCMSNLTLCSSVLLTGGVGSGKTAVSQWLGNRLREDFLFNVTFFSCQKLVTDEIRVSSIKETLTRLFMSASWCARLGGQSVVILDDLDKICPVETELQVGNDNGRSRQVTEILCSVVRQYCGIQSGVALLATAQSKDNLNNVIVGGHIVGDIISLKAPTKEIRRDIIAKLLETEQTDAYNQHNLTHTRQHSDTGSLTDSSWMNPSNPSTRPGSSSSSNHDGFRTSPSLDLLDIAGKTDGYMPADLNLLVSRARNECLIRTVSSTNESSSTSSSLILTKVDFAAALRNFTPASLRNVTLTHSSTTFSSVGGLKSTRSTLLETLLYPTKYAPIFAKSPLRLRSGLLLYGYPGCGKTLLASAVAGECNLNFISVKGPEILNKYIGASEKSVRDLFERAQAAKPCVLFFDEFDSIAPKRGHDSTGVTDRVVNQMLTQMDGAEGLDGVYVLAATSRPDLIDPALLRPGRLDKSLLCDMPNAEDREDILQAVSSGKLHTTKEVKSRISDIAQRTEGFSGADLQALMYNAHLEAIHDLLGDRTSSDASSDKKGGQMVNGTKTSPKSSTNSTARPPSRSRKTSADHNVSSSTNTNNKHDFIQFLYDPAADAEAKRTPSSAALDPRAVIAAKLDELKLARKQEKAMVRGGSQSNAHSSGSQRQGEGGRDKDGSDRGKGDEDSKVVIEWQHIERSLANTRASISAQERRRLGGIYREFVTGRNGEMPSGDGGREVGGRSTLM